MQRTTYPFSSGHALLFRRKKTESEIKDIHNQLLQASSEAGRTHHVENIYKRLTEKDERLEKGQCPRCGASLVVRTTKKGPNAGAPFLGFSRYPDCRYTRNID